MYSSLRIVFPALYTELMSDLLGELGTIGCQMFGADPVTMVAYFEGGDNLDAVERVVRSRLADLAVPDEAVAVERGVAEATDWEAAWRQSLHPVRVGRRWLVRPSWLSSDGFDRETLVIDPKMAFGTGTHATTQLCLIEMQNRVEPGMSVLDVGTGTGILAIAAAKMGADPVVGVEVDPDAVVCARENIALNDVGDRIVLVAGTIADAALASPPADLIIANIEYRTLVAIARDMRERIHHEGTAIFSGILQLETRAFRAELRRAGWRTIRVRRQFDPMTGDGWTCCVARPDREG